MCLLTQALVHFCETNIEVFQSVNDILTLKNSFQCLFCKQEEMNPLLKKNYLKKGWEFQLVKNRVLHKLDKMLHIIAAEARRDGWSKLSFISHGRD